MMNGNKNIMKTSQVVKSYFHPDAQEEFIVVDLLTNDGIISKILPMEDVLDRLVTFPQIKISEEKLLRTAENLVLGK